MASVKQLVARNDDATHLLPGTPLHRPSLKVESPFLPEHLSQAPGASGSARSIGSTTREPAATTIH